MAITVDDITTCVREGDYSKVKKFIEDNKEQIQKENLLNKLNRSGKSPLMEAIIFDKIDVARLLLEKGADSNLLSNEGNSALHIASGKHASNKDKIGMMRVLLERRADVNLYSKDGYTALHNCVSLGDLESVKFLLEQRADVNYKNKNGHTPLHMAAQRNNNGIAKLLLEKGEGVNVNIVDGYGETAFYIAVKQDNHYLAELFYSKYASVNGVGVKNPLHIAASNGSLSMVNYLLSKYASVNLRENGGNTALHEAATEGSIYVVKALINAGADVNVKNQYGQTPADVAKKDAQQELLDLLKPTQSPGGLSQASTSNAVPARPDPRTKPR